MNRHFILPTESNAVRIIEEEVNTIIQLKLPKTITRNEIGIDTEKDIAPS